MTGHIVTNETEKSMQALRKELGGTYGSRLARATVVTLTVIGLSVVSMTGAFAAATTTTTPSPRAAISAFRACMAKHGVTLSSRRPGAGGPPTSGGGGTGGGFFGRGGGGFDPTKVPTSLPKGVTAKKYLAAVQACKSEIPKGGFGGTTRRQFQAYISCLRDHGVNIPQRGSDSGGSGSGSSTTTTTGGLGGNGGGPLARLNRNDPAFQAANQICAPLLPNQGQGATTGTGSA